MFFAADESVLGVSSANKKKAARAGRLSSLKLK
jgi:hypothetical protein